MLFKTALGLVRKYNKTLCLTENSQTQTFIKPLMGYMLKQIFHFYSTTQTVTREHLALAKNGDMKMTYHISR